MQRACFTMTVAVDRLSDYESMHRSAWPELLHELRRAGWRNYSLFLRDDGFLIGYAESRDWPRSRREMDRASVSARWSAEMDQLVVPGSSMNWLSLVDAAGPAAPLPPSAVRRVETDTGAVDLDDHRIRFAQFAGTGTVTYLELAQDHPLASAPSPFRTVFDLDAQLDTAPRT